MRIKEPFAQERLSEEKTYKAKYFIASEGQTTEPKYFEKLNQSNNDKKKLLGDGKPSFLIHHNFQNYPKIFTMSIKIKKACDNSNYNAF